MKILIVEYLPRGNDSNTKILVDHFRAQMPGEIEILDLVEDVPDLFSPENLIPLLARNHGDVTLTSDEVTQVAKMDRMTDQVVSADIVVVACPMYNFSIPASVKAWIDGTVQKGRTWDMDSDHNFVGLMKGKKALTIMTGGSHYTEPPMSYMDYALPLMKTVFEFQEYSDVRDVYAGGTMSPDKDQYMQEAISKIDDIVADWS